MAAPHHESAIKIIPIWPAPFLRHSVRCTRTLQTCGTFRIANHGNNFHQQEAVRILPSRGMGGHSYRHRRTQHTGACRRTIAVPIYQYRHRTVDCPISTATLIMPPEQPLKDTPTGMVSRLRAVSEDRIAVLIQAGTIHCPPSTETLEKAHLR